MGVDLNFTSRSRDSHQPAHGSLSLHARQPPHRCSLIFLVALASLSHFLPLSFTLFLSDPFSLSHFRSVTLDLSLYHSLSLLSLSLIFFLFLILFLSICHSLYMPHSLSVPLFLSFIATVSRSLSFTFLTVTFSLKF